MATNVYDGFKHMLVSQQNPTLTQITPALGVAPAQLVWNGPPPNVTGGIIYHREKKFRPTPFSKAISAALELTVESKVQTSDLAFRVLSANDAIATFGKLKPMYAGRPQKWMLMLLGACPSPVQSYSKTASHYYFQGAIAGLFVKFPFIIGKRRARYRLTAAGLMLLDYYAGKHKAFAPFVDAYVTKKARDEINELSCDLIMGIEPRVLREEKAKAHKAQTAHDLKKLQEMVAEQERLRIERQRTNRQVHNTGTSTNGDYWADSQGAVYFTAAPHSSALSSLYLNEPHTSLSSAGKLLLGRTNL